jgi:type I restriction enzyme S subunit
VVNYVKTGVHDGFLIFLEPCFEQEFMFQWLEMFRSYWSKYGQPGSQVNLNSDLVKKQELSIPTLPEQEAIGTFFSTLDRQITLHQRKLDTLKEQKKTYLKLLFPSKGQTKPALRFQGFEDDWEEVKLGEVLSVSKLKNKENEYSKLNVLSVSREQGTVNQIEYQGRSFASDDVSGYKIVNVGQMIYTKSPLKGAPYGIFQTVTINGIVSPLYAVYNSSGRALASFVSLILKEDAIATHYLSPLVTKGAKNTINVTDEGALEGKVKIPTLPEQQAIGTFFQTLDREISQVEDKLASLKELKKTLLRKLFV